MLITWIILSFIVAFIGSDRKIGFFGTLILSLLLSPIIGALFALASDRKSKESKKEIESKEANKLYRLANKEFNNNNYPKSIMLLESALKYNPNSKLVLYNLSICYSAIKNKEKSFLYLGKAVRNGYNNFRQIQKDPILKFLRNQTEYNDFAINGYKFPPKIITDTTSKLERLVELKEKGALTEHEFETEKRKILMP